MLWLVHGDPGGSQKGAIFEAGDDPDSLWIAVDQIGPRPDCELKYPQTPFNALAALSARFASPSTDQSLLRISTFEGFGAVNPRPIKPSDHTLLTGALAQYVKKGESKISQIIIAGMSTLYDYGLAEAGGTVKSSGLDEAAKLVPAFAGSAIMHFLWNLKNSGIPILVSAWDIEVGKKRYIHGPRQVTQLADRQLMGDEFSPDEWKGIVDAVRAG